jgi:hypothetical protein
VGAAKNGSYVAADAEVAMMSRQPVEISAAAT